MAIAVDNTSNSPGNTTWSHTVGSGPDRLLVVLTGTHNGELVSGVTYGGASLTLAKDQNGSYRDARIYYLVNPPSGAANVVVSGTFTNYGCACCAISFENVDQSSPIRYTAGTNGTGYTVSSQELDVVLDVLCYISLNENSAYEPGAGQTEWFDFRAGSHQSCVGVSTKDGASPSVSLSWTPSGMLDSNHAWASVSIAPSSTPSVSDDFTINDSVDAWKNPDGISDTVGISDTITAGLLRQGAVSDGLTVTDEVDATRAFGKAVSDGLTVNDTVDASGVYTRGVSDAVGIADTVDTQTEYNPALPGNFTLADIVDAILNNPLRRKQIPLKLQGTHITLRFRNNAATQDLHLVDIGIKKEKLVGMSRSKAIQIKLTGGHIRLRFRNNTIDESLKLEYMGAKIEGYMAR